MFTTPLGLLALLGVPAVVGLHLYRQQAKQRKVSALFLWEGMGSPRGSGRKRQPLHRSPSFWLELLAVVLLALALAGVRGCGGSAEHRVIVLDDSASMQAVEGPARQALDKELRGLKARDRVSVVLTGASPRMLVGPGALREEVDPALDRWSPAAASHDPGAAIDLALQLSAGGELTFITDDFQPQNWPPEVGLVALGEPADNLGLSHAQRVRGPADSDLVFAMLRSFSDEPAAGTLELWEGETRLAERPITLPPDGVLEEQISVPHSAGMLRLALVLPSERNALPLDDEAWLAPLPPRTLGLHLALSEDRARALGLDASGERWATLVPDARLVSADRAHIVLGEAVDAPDTWRIELPPQGESAALLGPFLVAQDHPITRGMSLEGVIWSLPTQPPPPGQALITAGSEALLLQRGQGHYRLNLDPARSSLARSPDWPILLLNLAEARRAALPGLSRTTTQVGQSLVWRSAPLGEWTLTDPAGRSRKLPHQEALDIGGLSTPGVWTVQRDQEPPTEIAVNALDPLESELRGRSAGARAAEGGSAVAEASVSLSDSALLILLLLVLALDWWALRNDDRLVLPRVAL